MRKVILLLCVLLTYVAAFSQTRVVTGKVVDKGGDALIGVSVNIKGSTKGVSTDVNGGFKITVPTDGNTTLVFKYVGFKDKEVSVGTNSTLSVILAEDVTSIKEVQVNIGYGTVKKEALTGTVSTISAQQIKDVPVSSAAEALAGRLAGVQVTSTEGSPGAEVQIRVRGGGSLTQDNSPLYIVDNVQIDNALSIISPQEIESITVLKDAASTAIYGAKGANGVVLITTKGGKDMKTQISYNAYGGYRAIVNKLAVLSPYEYVKYQFQARTYAQRTDALDTLNNKTFQSTYGSYDDIDLYKSIATVDWQDKVFGRNAFNQTHAVNLIGGTKTTTFNFTLNHADEEGIMIGSGFQRTLASLKFDHKVNDRLKVGVNTRYSRQRIDGIGTSSSGSQGTNRLRNSVRYKPFTAGGDVSVDEFDPNYLTLANLTNPVILANNEIKNDYRNDIFVNGYVNLDLLKHLSFRATAGVTGTDRKTNQFSGTVTSVARQNNNQPVVTLGNSQNTTLTNTNTLTYKNTFSKDHNFDLVLGEETWQTKSISNASSIKWFPVEITAEQAFASIQKAVPPSGLIQDAPTSLQTAETQFSLFGRANYGYKGKYLATIAIRRDESSKFAPENRVGTFPSAQIAWRLSEESFLKGTKDWLSNLKLRLSYGSAGNNRMDIDLWKSMFTASSIEGYAYNESVSAGLYNTDLANRSLKWETTISKNIGIDATFLNRYNFTVDFYKNDVKDLLYEANIPSSMGFLKQLQNIGRTQNKGVEFQIDGPILSKRDFTWTGNFNLSFNRNKVASLGLDPSGNLKQSDLIPSGWITADYQDFSLAVGQPLGQFYGYQYDGFYTLDDFTATQHAPDAGHSQEYWTYALKPGIANTKTIALSGRDPQPGDLKLKKLTAIDPNDPTSALVTTADRTIIGNAQPKFIGGFNQQFAYKNFDLSLFMNFSYGNKVYNANKVEFTSATQRYDNNMLAEVQNRWQWFDESGQIVSNPAILAEMNKNTSMFTPALGNYILSSYAIEDGSFLRISNITLGYTLPKAAISKTKVISNLRVYGTVNNLHTFTRYSGYDPEANTRRNSTLTPGVDYAAYPRSRFIVFGLNASF